MKINIITLGKLVQTLSPMVIILISPYFTGNEDLNYLYGYLAITNIIYSVSNYGNNGKLSFYYRSIRKKEKFIMIYSLVRCLAFLTCVMVLSKVYDVRAVIVICSIMPLAFNFIEYLSECASEKDLEFYARAKIVLFSIGFLIKSILISRNEIDSLLIIMNIEWIFLYLIVRYKITSIPQDNYKASQKKWLKDSFYIYISYFVQIFTTRYLYLNSTGEGKESFFIILRVVEAFNFIPNAYAARFFSNYHNLDKKEMRLTNYLRDSKNISIKTSILASSCIGVYFFLIGFEIDLKTIFILIFSYFLFKRISLSRYIIISDLIYISPLSYWIPAAFILPLSFYVKDAYALYCIYLLSIYMTLPVLFYKRFRNYILYSYAFKN